MTGLRNNRPGLWWTFRCADCGQMKLTLNGAMYRGAIGAMNKAMRLGWACEDISSIAIGLTCPACVKVKQNPLRMVGS